MELLVISGALFMTLAFISLGFLSKRSQSDQSHYSFEVGGHTYVLWGDNTRSGIGLVSERQPTSLGSYLRKLLPRSATFEEMRPVAGTTGNEEKLPDTWDVDGRHFQVKTVYTGNKPTGAEILEQKGRVKVVVGTIQY